MEIFIPTSTTSQEHQLQLDVMYRARVASLGFRVPIGNIIKLLVQIHAYGSRKTTCFEGLFSTRQNFFFVAGSCVSTKLKGCL